MTKADKLREMAAELMAMAKELEQPCEVVKLKVVAREHE